MPEVTLSSISIPFRERKWIDITPERFQRGCQPVSKMMTRLLRHDSSIPREDDGAVRFDDLLGKLKARYESTSEWTVSAWIIFLTKGGGRKKSFQYCLNPNSPEHFLYFRAIQGHSGGNLVDPTLQDNVLLPENFTEYIFHVGNVSELHSITRSGLIPGERDRQSVFFTAVNPMDVDPRMAEVQYDLSQPRVAPHKDTWKNYQNTISWCNSKLAQKKGLQFYQTRSHAIILFDTLPAICIEKAVCMKTKEE